MYSYTVTGSIHGSQLVLQVGKSTNGGPAIAGPYPTISVMANSLAVGQTPRYFYRNATVSDFNNALKGFQSGYG